MEMSSITEPISVFDFRTGSGQKAQEPVIVEMSAQAPWMDPPAAKYLGDGYWFSGQNVQVLLVSSPV